MRMGKIDKDIYEIKQEKARDILKKKGELVKCDAETLSSIPFSVAMSVYKSDNPLIFLIMH